MFAMEATGVYWKPVRHVLEADFELVLANAQHIRNGPGRKTDVSDAAWIADLLAHGLIRGSFVPPARIQALRDLTRKQLVREVAQHALRIQKVLEDANLKVASVALQHPRQERARDARRAHQRRDRSRAARRPYAGISPETSAGTWASRGSFKVCPPTAPRPPPRAG